MLREIIVAPFVVVLILGFVLQIANIAESASEKVVNYADEINNALDCAFDGISIYECSPGLDTYNFEEDLTKYKDYNAEFLANITKIFENGTVISEGDYIIVKYPKS